MLARKEHLDVVTKTLNKRRQLWNGMVCIDMPSSLQGTDSTIAPVHVTLQSKVSGISPFILGMTDWRLQVKLQGVQHATFAAGCWLEDREKHAILTVGCTQLMPCS